MLQKPRKLRSDGPLGSYAFLIMLYMLVSDQKTRNSGEGEFLGVPGELRGFEAAWKKYGRLPWKDLFQPAIEIATEGFPASPALEWAVSLNQRIINNDPGLR